MMAAVTRTNWLPILMDEKKCEYFSSINSMAKKIMLERQKIKERYGAEWEKLQPSEQEKIIDNWMIDPQIQARYAVHKRERENIVCYPKLQIETGQKIVHFGDEDITWQDEHSAPFSWETKSQMEFSLASVDQSGTPAQIEQRQPIKASQGAQPVKVCHGRTTSSDGLTPGRKEESSSSSSSSSSSFWKISAERSRLEGDQADFQSLTPSQIKSLEKGEKPPPLYSRQESGQKEKKESTAEKPQGSKQEKIVLTNIPSSAEWDTPEPSQASPPAVEEDLKPEAGVIEKQPDAEDPMADAQLFSQINTSSVLLKTGFDFLDNW
ncbi:uncharacterized protein C1orf198 homolog [Latimeria chalumnae]|uniref:Chromosome 1 open reading frame 198 n=1 Tax=Latimeria chalumnae TaxID=7897 RepID=H3A4M6_LATCH|nr:PREDICTED: uncharacterized protein C1orf198 homolog [Latimeria chalumnae]|eukprot:XP_006008220.1 PREDICTED: uncharacterized protein C1orf198 homolog [Latimeria chalumnae]